MDLSEIRFGALVRTSAAGLTNDWLFLGWDEAHEKLWLARPQEEGREKRGANLLLMSKERVVSFRNDEPQRPLAASANIRPQHLPGCYPFAPTEGQVWVCAEGCPLKEGQ